MSEPANNIPGRIPAVNRSAMEIFPPAEIE